MAEPIFDAIVVGSGASGGWVAKELTEIEPYAAVLARHFVESQQPIDRARVQIEEYFWDRLGPHSFARSGREIRTAEVTYDGELAVVSGLKDLTLLNSTDSEFRGYVKDRYTTLAETDDRVLATAVNARWRHTDTDADWAASYETVRAHLIEAFVGTYSKSLQQTLYAMGERVIDNCQGIDEIRLSLPNKHHFLVDLERFGIANDGEIFVASDRPYGLIEATVLRDGAAPLLPTD